jgi:hypothetical protein
MIMFLHSWGVFWRISTGCYKVLEMSGRYWLSFERLGGFLTMAQESGKMDTACVTSSNVLILDLDEFMTENYQEVLPD